MIISLGNASPFYAAYAYQAEVIDAAIEDAINKSGEKLGIEMVKQLYSIIDHSSHEKMAA